MKTEEAFAVLKEIRAYVHPPAEPGFEPWVVVEFLETRMKALEDVAEAARKMICKENGACYRPLCRAVAILDGKRLPE